MDRMGANRVWQTMKQNKNHQIKVFQFYSWSSTMLNYSFVQKQLQEWQLEDSLLQKSSKLLKKIHANSRKQSITYRQQLANRKSSRPQSSPSPSLHVQASINELRQISTQQKLQAQNIANRLKYLNTSTERQEKLVIEAKQKFSRISEIRRQSFTEKSFLSCEREGLLVEHSKTVFLKASKIKSERHKLVESQQKVMQERKEKVKAVKQEREVNESVIKDQRAHQQSIRSQKVLRIHQQQQAHRQNSRSRSQQRISAGITNHKNMIISKFQNVQRQIKLNKSLMKSFEQRAYKIYDKKQKQEKELEQYRGYLGLERSRVDGSSGGGKVAVDDTMVYKYRQGAKGNDSSTATSKANENKGSFFTKMNDRNPPAHKGSQLRFQQGNVYLTNPESY